MKKEHEEVSIRFGTARETAQVETRYGRWDKDDEVLSLSQMKQEELPLIGQVWFDPDYPSLQGKLQEVTAKPYYNWNPIRWILKKPKYWNVTVHYVIQPQTN